MAITTFKVVQGHRFWYRSKAHMRLPIVGIIKSLRAKIPSVTAVRDVEAQWSEQ